MFDFITSEPEEWEEKSEEVELQLEEKYHRFAVYVSCIALVIDLSMIYNKFNFLDVLSHSSRSLLGYYSLGIA